jgi:hypothetical protein
VYCASYPPPRNTTLLHMTFVIAASFIVDCLWAYENVEV